MIDIINRKALKAMKALHPDKQYNTTELAGIVNTTWDYMQCLLICLRKHGYVKIKKDKPCVYNHYKKYHAHHGRANIITLTPRGKFLVSNNPDIFEIAENEKYKLKIKRKLTPPTSNIEYYDIIRKEN